MTPRFFVYGHQDKGDPYVASLLGSGWSSTRSPKEAHIILADVDSFGRDKGLGYYHRSYGVSTVLYPHGAVASCLWNFPGVKHFDFVAAVAVPSSGYSQVMTAYGCPYGTFQTGWTWSPVHEFRRTSGRTILFAPIHPNSNGYLSEVDRSLNGRVYQLLLDICRTGLHSLTVRHSGDLKANGLWHSPGVHYMPATLSLKETCQVVQQYDLVVSKNTFQYVSVAMGTPTIGMGEFIAPHYGGSDEALKYVTSWDRYKGIMAFPLDLVTEQDPHFLIERVIYSDYEIADWKARMIGSPFDPKKFSDYMKEIVDGSSNRDREEVSIETKIEASV